MCIVWEMKISCNEGLLTALASRGCFTKEGRLNYRKETKKSYKERWFKLRANLLFYYKTNDFGIICEDEPRGCLVLARYTLKEELVANALFAFSITFHGSNEKHYFVGQSTDHCRDWIDILQNADIDILRQQILNMRIQLRQINPLLSAPKEIVPPIFKKSKKLLTNIPKRLEKKIVTGDDKKKKDNQLTVEWHIPKAKSSSALEQVRKSYSLASLMNNSSKYKAKCDPSANKSTFFVDENNFFGNIGPLDGLSNSFDTFNQNNNSVNESLCKSDASCTSSNFPLIDLSDKKEDSVEDSDILRIKRTKCPDATVCRPCHLDPGDFPIFREHHSNRYDIVLKPLALVSDPFVNNFTKPSISSNKRDCCFLKQESEDLLSKERMPIETDIIYRRPRSCTLAQLESIPSHLLGGSLSKEVVFSIGDDVLGSEHNNQLIKRNCTKKDSSARKCTGFQNWETFEE